MSCLQTLVALSSGEAEYFASIRGACTSLGIQSHYQDWMIDVPTQVYSDTSAARSVARRRGIGGRLRQMQTRHLWLQSRVALGRMCSRNHCQDAKSANDRNMLVRDGCSNRGNNNNEWWKTSWRMLGDDPQSADIPGSLESFQQLQQCLSSCSSRNCWERAESIGPVNAERQRSRGQVKRGSSIQTQHDSWDERVWRWSKSTVGRMLHYEQNAAEIWSVDDCDETMWRSWVECQRILCFEVSNKSHSVHSFSMCMCSTMYVGWACMICRLVYNLTCNCFQSQLFVVRTKIRMSGLSWAAWQAVYHSRCGSRRANTNCFQSVDQTLPVQLAER